MIRFIQIGFVVVLMMFHNSCGSDTAVVSDTEWELLWNDEFHEEGIDDSIFPQKYKIDYVRVYQLAEN